MSSSSSSSSSGIGHLQTSNLLRLTGTNLMSGLDTDSIVKALTAGTQSKITKQKQLQQIAEWKQSMYRDVTTSMKTFSSTYFSYINSSTNILSSSFFESGALTSSSNAVTASGKASDAAAIKIETISQLASAASYNSQKISNEAITSGKIYDNWQQSDAGGNSVVVSYGGNDYTLYMSSDISLDSNNQTSPGSGVLNDTEVQKVVTGLNDQISANSSLSGKVKFDYTSGKITLTALNASGAEDSTKTLGLKVNNSDAARSASFLTAMGFQTVGAPTGTGHLTGQTNVQTTIASSGFFSHKISGSSQFTLNYGGETYTLKLGSDIDTSGGQSDVVSKMVSQLNTQISSITGLTGNIKFVQSSSDPTKIELQNNGTQNLTVTGVSEDLETGLGMTVSGQAPSVSSPLTVTAGSSYTSTSVNLTNLSTVYLGDALKGSTLTFNLDGLNKSITFGDDESQYDDLNGAVVNGVNTTGISKLQTYLQNQLNSNFGSGTITVSASSTGLSFSTSNPTSVLKLTSSDGNNVLNQNGALRMNYGSINRLDLGMSLNDIKSEFKTALTAGSDGTYKMQINGENFSFSGTDTVGDVVSKINNDAAAGVTVSYSQTSDSFRIVSSDTGSQGKVSVTDLSGGNLAQALFGVTSSASTGTIAASSTDPSGSSYELAVGGNNPVTISLPTNGSYGSLADLATAVNTAIGSSSLNGKVTATVASDHLVFQTVGAAAGQSVILSSSGPGNVLNVSNKAGTDLKMSVDLNGSSTPTDITRSSNSFTLDGVTITANRVTTGSDGPITLSSSSTSTDDLYKKIVDFVNTYNTLINKVNTYTSDSPEKDSNHKNKYAPLTDDQKADMTSDEIDKWNAKAQQGLLQNDNTLNGILSDFTNVINSVETQSGLSLSQIGISTPVNDYKSGGQLAITSTTLKSALATEPDRVEKLFTDATDGIATKMAQVMDKYAGTSGGTGQLITLAGTSATSYNDTSAMGVQIKRYESTIDDLNTQLSTEQDRWWAKFSRMEQSLGTLNSQMGYLNSMTSNSSSSS